MRGFKPWIGLTLGMAAATSAVCGDSAAPQVIEHPAPASVVDDGGTPDEPQITIRESGDTVIEEYRIGGELYMIKLTPSKGAPYYLVDSDGDGSLERRWNDREPRLMIPSWVLLRWR